MVILSSLNLISIFGRNFGRFSAVFRFRRFSVLARKAKKKTREIFRPKFRPFFGFAVIRIQGENRFPYRSVIPEGKT